MNKDGLVDIPARTAPSGNGMVEVPRQLYVRRSYPTSRIDGPKGLPPCLCARYVMGEQLLVMYHEMDCPNA